MTLPAGGGVSVVDESSPPLQDITAKTTTNAEHIVFTFFIVHSFIWLIKSILQLKIQ